MVKRTSVPTGSIRTSTTRSRASLFTSTASRQPRRYAKQAFFRETSGWINSVKRLLRTHLAFTSETNLAVADIDAIWLLDIEKKQKRVFAKHRPRRTVNGVPLTTVVSEIVCSNNKTMIGWI